MKSGITGHTGKAPVLQQQHNVALVEGDVLGASVYYMKSPRLNDKLTISNLLGDV